MTNKEEKGGILTMNATRATTMTTDGAVFGTTTENPPEDPPPEQCAIKQCAVRSKCDRTLTG